MQRRNKLKVSVKQENSSGIIYFGFTFKLKQTKLWQTCTFVKLDKIFPTMMKRFTLVWKLRLLVLSHFLILYLSHVCTKPQRHTQRNISIFLGIKAKDKFPTRHPSCLKLSQQWNIRASEKGETIAQRSRMVTYHFFISLFYTLFTFSASVTIHAQNPLHSSNSHGVIILG